VRRIVSAACTLLLSAAMTTAAETPAETLYRWLVRYCQAIPEPDQQWDCWTALARENMRATSEATRNGREDSVRNEPVPPGGWPFAARPDALSPGRVPRAIGTESR